MLYLLLYCVLSMQCQAKEIPKIQLATVYKDDLNKAVNINEYFISEKLDGIRGFWNGQNLVTRGGNIIYAPSWFTQDWPNEYIDGELWSSKFFNSACSFAFAIYS